MDRGKGSADGATGRLGMPLASARRGVLLCGLGGLLCMAGCSELAYYRQSVAGQMEILSRRHTIDALIAADDRPRPLRRQLEQVSAIRAFAIHQLGLPGADSFTTYADLGRGYAVLALYAAPEFSTTLKSWCYPVAGCADYRGYFDRDMLQTDAGALRDQGYDVYVAAVPAYSTLGWFNDPVLNTVIDWPRPRLAGLLFHELAHRQLYIKGDTTFNESFATAVEQAGVELWLQRQGDAPALADYRRLGQRRQQVVQLVAATRERLHALYERHLPVPVMRAHKQRSLEQARERYQALRRKWQQDPGYDAWFNDRLNNARLGSIAAYHGYVAGFRAMLTRLNNDFPAFYAEAARLGALAADARRVYLSRGFDPPAE